MRALFRTPVIQAARTAASYRLLTEGDLHLMGIRHIEKAMRQDNYEVLFVNETVDMFPQLKVYKEGEPLIWVIIQSAMYPVKPKLSRILAQQVFAHAPSEQASLMYAPVMFVNTKSQNISLPSVNGSFTALFGGFEKVTKQYIQGLY